MYKTSYLQRQAEVAEVAKYRHHTCKYEQTCKKSKYVYIYLFICYNITLHIRGMAVWMFRNMETESVSDDEASQWPPAYSQLLKQIRSHPAEGAVDSVPEQNVFADKPWVWSKGHFFGSADKVFV